MVNSIRVFLILFSVVVAFPTYVSASNYYLGEDIINPDPPVISKSETYLESLTGQEVERLTTVTELTGGSTGLPSDSMVVYSRYSPINTTGEYMIVHGTNSTSAWVVRLSDNAVLHKVDPGPSVGASADEIGEVHEIRWDYSGEHPHRIYFVNATKFYQMDVINGNNLSTELFDIATYYPSATFIRNDVEGDSSSDSRYWAWQVWGPYDSAEGRYPVLAFIVYDKNSDQLVGRLEPGDVTPSQNEPDWQTELPRPNMVEISPNGDKVHLNFGRCYATASSSSKRDFIGTVFDGPHVFDLEFSNPIKVGITETHSGWAWDSSGKQLFLHHMNRAQNGYEDMLQACYVDGTGGTYPDNCFYYWDLRAHNYVGQHMTRMPSSRPGWMMMSTYATSKPAIQRSTPYTAYEPRKFYTPDGIHQYQVTVAGTTAASAPTPPADPTIGQTYTDGGVTFRYRGKIYADNQLLMTELKPVSQSPRTWRISPTYNEYGGGYRDEGCAAISPSGNTIAWTSNWQDEANGHGEVYRVDLPSDWLVELSGGRLITCYLDEDGDGYSEGTSEMVESCSANYYPVAQLKMTSGDCDDSNPQINPGARDIPKNGIDEDCSGSDESSVQQPRRLQLLID